VSLFPGSLEGGRILRIQLEHVLIRADRLLRIIDELDLPLYRPLEHEQWLFELVGSRS
jgi:hypothetical protein